MPPANLTVTLYFDFGGFVLNIQEFSWLSQDWDFFSTNAAKRRKSRVKSPYPNYSARLKMHELVVNLHMHTVFSDGSGTHKDIAKAALQANLDAVIVTDHNVLVNGPEGFYGEGKKRVLMLIAEEVHDQARVPQKNHLLVFDAGQEMATYAPQPQNLIDNVRRAGGLSFIAHLYDPECAPIKETDISWVDWSAQDFTGIELWNGMSEMKVRGKTFWHLLFYVFFPHFLALQPPVQHLTKWDELLKRGNKIVAVGGSDAHAFQIGKGLLHKTVYPYEFHFQTINTHILTPSPLSGNVESDRKMVYQAFAAGHAFVGYDLPASTKGFRLTAQGKEATALMGDEIPAEGGVTFTFKLPQAAECHLLKDGNIIQSWKNREAGSFTASEPGVYRMEVYRPYLGQRRGWIFSNPIYVR
jgi:hypothetical protein